MKHVALRIAFLVALGLAAPATAAEVVVAYMGPHPIDPALMKGMCYIEGPHVHAYKPHRDILYVKTGDAYAFVGDPAEFEPAAPSVTYYGHHPLFWVDVPDAYCYITGPHHHWAVPPPALAFKVKGGALWFVGAHPAWYKARVDKHLDAYYASIHLVRPVVTVAPPVGFVGVAVGLPSVHVVAPSIQIGLPGFVVGEPVLVGKPGHRGRGHAWGHYKGKGKWK